MKYEIISFLYRHIAKPVFFTQDPEKIHDLITRSGQTIGRFSLTRSITKGLFSYSHPALEVSIGGIKYKNPIGLSAGFDYDGKLTNILPDVGFGFESIGTVTNSPYVGNQKPRLGRLPKSKSLLVNKGFKSEGLVKVLEKNVRFADSDFRYGISIGATNSPKTATADTQKEDIFKSFKYLNQHPSAKKFSYFELNISCPNVAGSGNLANPKDLEDMLSKLDKLKLKRPLWVKFQLEIDWPDAQKLIKIMVKHKVQAIVIANLLKNRQSSFLDKSEVNDIKDLKGNLSGKPTWKLSNELISKTYQHFGDKIIIVGVGGVFSAEDAYEKIKLGASLVQLITGMVYEGPQLIGEINKGLKELLEKDGYKNIAEAVGVKS